MSKSQVLRFAFYPRPLGGGRRHFSHPYQCDGYISIHALRVEGDAQKVRVLLKSRHFYPRPPDGGRSHFSPWKIGYECISIHALWVEGDVLKAVIRITVCISIHALRVEGDEYRYMFSAIMSRFLSTPSGWRATMRSACDYCRSPISIHALRAEGDVWRCADRGSG